MRGRAIRSGAVLVLLSVGLAAILTSVAQAATPTGPSQPAARACAKGPAALNSCPGVRPGALLFTPIGQCTFNFLFVGGDGHRYIGSAGHCFLKDDGEEVWSGDEGPDVLDSRGRYVGDAAYAVMEGPHRGRDFALIRIRQGIRARAAMCFFGGPTGINEDITTDPVVIKYFGNGGFIGWEPTTGANTVPSRSGVATEGLPDPEFAQATAPVFFGDSGSGVISDDGRAVGVAVVLQPSYKTMGIARLGHQLIRAEEMLGTTLRLRTAELSV